MRRIILSLGAITFVAAAAITASGAFFSDQETSSGNTFAAGSLVLTVDDVQHYAGLVCVANVEGGGHHWIQDTTIGPNPTTRSDLLNTPCDGTWDPTTLGPANHFFDFSDLKPGDPGENTISLHTSNDAWACLNIGTNANNENGVNGPELAAGDNPSANGPADGELAQNVTLFAWKDNGSNGENIKAGDNIYEPGVGETPLFGGSGVVTLPAFGATTTLPLADSTTGTGPLAATSTNYIGLAWCVGSTTVDSGTGKITCDGSTVGNIIQTDSATSTIQFNVVQSRNNPKFTCGQGTTTPLIVPVTANNLNGWSWFDDTNNVINNALGTFVVGPGTPPLGTGSASTTLASSTSRVFLQNNSYGNIPLSTLTQLAFTEFSQSGVGGPNEAPFVRFNVDFTTGSTTFQGSLVYVPSANGSIVKDTWQSWNMITPGSLWNYSRPFWPAGITTVANTVPGTTNRTWASILADYPNIRTWATGPQIGIRFGEPGPAGYSGNADSFTIATSGPATTYDFGN
jgi:predicted ribosomally synthesized peptide with SipW-like signal peptide